MVELPTEADPVKVVCGDALETLRELPDECVNCCITSPPYYGLRDYGCDGQIGLENTPAEYVAKLVSVFREVRRVLRSDGTVWLNLGDSYNGGGGYSPDSPSNQGRRGFNGDAKSKTFTNAKRRGHGGELKSKDLIGVPWVVAFALRADGWYLRQDIIWAKPNPMPESVTDRCTKSHEYLFLLSKSERYHYDADAIAEAVSDTSLTRWNQDGIEEQAGSDRVPGKTNGPMKAVGGPQRAQAQRAVELAREKGLTQAHLEAIRAVGITDAGKAKKTQSGAGKNAPDVMRLAEEAKAALGGYYREFLIAERRNKRSVWTVTTKPYKGAHFATMPPDLVEPCVLAGCAAGGVVLDPFAGSGTTLAVAVELGRRAIGCELNPEYVKLIDARMRRVTPTLFAETA